MATAKKAAQKKLHQLRKLLLQKKLHQLKKLLLQKSCTS